MDGSLELDQVQILKFFMLSPSGPMVFTITMNNVVRGGRNFTDVARLDITTSVLNVRLPKAM